MTSHEYRFKPAEVGRLLGASLAPMLIISGLLRLGALSGILPSPWPAFDVDHTVLLHQARASRLPNSADIVALGDSSCLMNFAPQQFDAACGGPHSSINLGTFMYLGFDGYTALLKQYAEAHPRALRAVLLLLHPDMLRGTAAVPHYLDVLSDFYSGADHTDLGEFQGQLCGVFGLTVLQDRLLSRLPTALPQGFGHYYGFNLDLYQFMDRERGWALDPHQYRPVPGVNTEYRLSRRLEDAGRSLRPAVPAGARLVLGITPLPGSAAPAHYATRYQALLAEWGEWMTADVLLTNLPPILPDYWFASSTHLNEVGARQYTKLVAEELRAHLE